MSELEQLSLLNRARVCEMPRVTSACGIELPLDCFVVSQSMQYLLAGISALLNCCCASDVLLTSCIRVAWRCSTSEMLVQAYAIAWVAEWSAERRVDAPGVLSLASGNLCIRTDCHDHQGGDCVSGWVQEQPAPRLARSKRLIVDFISNLDFTTAL